MPSRKLKLALAGGFVLSMGTLAAQAADLNARPEVGFGKPVIEADLALWNIDIHTPSGGNLPPGEGTVSAGKAVYEARCLACHGESAAGGPMYGTMVGGIGTMDKNPRVLTPGSVYPYAPILFDYVRRAMPLDQPQSLTADDRPDVRAERCMTNCKPIGTVADADPRPSGKAETTGRAGGTGGQVIMGTGTDASNKRP
jgi:S-disulfanyl-L-cysteine oxidoreductase SoxD